VGSEFKQNSASGYGAGIAIGDGASLNASQSTFTSNGAAACSSSRPQVSYGFLAGSLLRGLPCCPAARPLLAALRSLATKCCAACVCAVCNLGCLRLPEPNRILAFF
jgi:hypothetical protein